MFCQDQEKHTKLGKSNQTQKPIQSVNSKQVQNASDFGQSFQTSTSSQRNLINPLLTQNSSQRDLVNYPSIKSFQSTGQESNFYKMPQCVFDTQNSQASSQRFNPLQTPQSVMIKCISQERGLNQIPSASSLQQNQIFAKNQPKNPLIQTFYFTDTQHNHQLNSNQTQRTDEQTLNSIPQTSNPSTQKEQQTVEHNVYLNLILVEAFKVVYRALDPQKKGYIKLKDLSEAVKGVEGEAKRNALIKFFVSFVKQTNKHYISKVSFLTNAVNAYLHKKYDFYLFVKNIDEKLQIKFQTGQDYSQNQQVPNAVTKQAQIQPKVVKILEPKYEDPKQPKKINYPTIQIDQYETPQGDLSPRDDGDINLLYYKYFSGQVSNPNKLSKQNQLYIQHLLAQSQAYQQHKKSNPSQTASFNNQSNKENTNSMKPKSPKNMGSFSSRPCLSRNTSQPAQKQTIHNNFKMSTKQLKRPQNQMSTFYKLKQSFSSKTNSNSTYELSQSTFDNGNKVNQVKGPRSNSQLLKMK